MEINGVNYPKLKHELKQNTKLSPEQRLAALETLQQEYPRLMKQEDNFARYEQAVQLLDERQPTAETQRLKQELQQRSIVTGKQIGRAHV